MRRKITEEKLPEIPESIRLRIRADVAAGVSVTDDIPEKIHHRNRKRIPAICGAITVLVLVFSCFFARNPAYAKNVPVLGSVFATIGNTLGFGGDFEKYTDSDTGSDKTLGGEQSCTVNGVTVTVEEPYCSKNAIYIPIAVDSRKAFPVDQIADNYGKPDMSLQTYSFKSDLFHTPELPGEVIEGDFIDDHRYEGVLRISSSWFREQEYENAGIFSADFRFSAISAFVEDKGTDQKNRAGHESTIAEGPWEFHLEGLHINTEGTETRTFSIKALELTNAKTITITKTPFDVNVHFNGTYGEYIAFVVDADGRILTPGGFMVSNSNELAAKDHDLSSMTLYICEDPLKWLDHTYNIYEKTGDLRDYLEKNSVWHKEVVFE